ncbi:40S ribosomal protein SSA (nucleomorph) [Cryptomonas paramecium]|uniref:Small ribosomal subunit protein uS2 n=1 Tax=Cryptomonas paramaecium TaxID=2898 RepID=F2HI10_9CRYP|nr:40S ribosomal protein SSA [Cryptomonas paramecium]AEA38956.1 40S ribosomal protein SSA [Cryptomonas paramecium]|mmetsp:Transcript_29356/g.77102  ORF Transcript_29356/g.77102 Transcript_29356/m.77102 type:complete len:209 (+) Transcript_29356:3966-4592(+)
MKNKTYYLDIKKMILCDCHLGLNYCTNDMKMYVWKMRQDGIFIFNVLEIFKRIKIAAKAVASVRNKEEVIVVSCSNENMASVLRFSSYTGCKVILGKWVPGRITNQFCKDFIQPRLVIVADCSSGSQAISEASKVGLPVIAFCNTDTLLKFVDIVIPLNNKNKYSTAFSWWLLTREVLFSRDSLNPMNWKVPLEFFLDKNTKEYTEAI